MKTPTGVTIGTTIGLATKEFSGEGCEQAYAKETGDEQRPIRLEFWEGYSVPNIAVLTRNQAIQLAYIILRWAGPSLSTLTKMLDEAIFHADSVIPSTRDQEKDHEQYTQLLREMFKKWLAEVGLPDYFSIKGDTAFNSTESIRKLLITLVDEP